MDGGEEGGSASTQTREEGISGGLAPLVAIPDKVKIEEWFSFITGCDEDTFSQTKDKLIKDEGDGTCPPAPPPLPSFPFPSFPMHVLSFRSPSSWKLNIAGYLSILNTTTGRKSKAGKLSVTMLGDILLDIANTKRVGAYPFFLLPFLRRRRERKEICPPSISLPIRWRTTSDMSTWRICNPCPKIETLSSRSLPILMA